jgi:(S)-citramalyl-CoA lyase
VTNSRDVIGVTQALGLQSMLFVPGSRPDRFAKALASGADIVCIDLEDAVGAADKSEARTAALAAAASEPRYAIRINGLTTRDGLADLLAIAQASSRPRLVFIPKVESAHEIVIARDVIDDRDIGFAPLIETVRGLDQAQQIAGQAQVCMLMLGGADLSAQLGVELSWDPLLVARSQLIMACAGAGIPAMDVPYIKLDDAHGLAEEARRAKALGFSAKAAIHPAQIDTIHMVFRPDAELIAEAYEARSAFRAAGGSAVRFKGKMLEAPFMRRYEQIIAIGERVNA